MLKKSIFIKNDMKWKDSKEEDADKKQLQWQQKVIKEEYVQKEKQY